MAEQTSVNKRAMFTSQTCEWGTPRALFEDLNREFGFTFDACATDANALCPEYVTGRHILTEDAMLRDWPGTVWMNPPYGRTIGQWVEKAYQESQKGSTVVCLLPARTDTRWWHDFVLRGQVRFIKGRLKFGDAKKDAPFPSAVVVFARGHPRRGVGQLSEAQAVFTEANLMVESIEALATKLCARHHYGADEPCTCDPGMGVTMALRSQAVLREGQMRSPENIDRRNEWKKANQRAMYRLRTKHRKEYDRLMAEELAKAGLGGDHGG